MKPHRTIKNIVVHPKDKRDPLQTAEAVYRIDCDSCSKSYIGETGRLFKTRFNEHKNETDKISARTFTRAKKKASTSGDEVFKSAVAEHVAHTNHVIGWDKARIIDLEANETVRWLKESIWVRRRGNSVMNKDEGNYKLQQIYDQLLIAKDRQPGASRDDVTQPTSQ